MNKQNPFDLTGKIALVTGASRGIGEGIARLLAAQGAHVIVSSRKQDACEAVAASIREEGGKAEAYACHIGEMDQIDRLFADLEARHGRIDILVNNAATNPHFGHITETDAGAFQKTEDMKK
jgi:NAD(P)-dependent dehydrogenase (short-subunit alcohol dehydrogenase family)